MTDEMESFAMSELEGVLLFRGVELGSIQEILESCPVQKLKSGEVLIESGKPNHSIHVLLTGQLTVHLELSLQPIARLEQGEVAGEISVVDGEPATAYVVAEEDCRVLELSEDVLWSLLEASPRIAHNLLFVVVQRLRRGDSLIRALSLAGG